MTKKICTVEGCNKVVHCKGLCNRHYYYLLKERKLSGKPLDIKKYIKCTECEKYEQWCEGLCKSCYDSWLKVDNFFNKIFSGTKLTPHADEERSERIADESWMIETYDNDLIKEIEYYKKTGKIKSELKIWEKDFFIKKS